MYTVSAGERLQIGVKMVNLTEKALRPTATSIKGRMNSDGSYSAGKTPGDKDIITISVTDSVTGRVAQASVPVVVAQ
ncbi:MAG: hypothetical protein GY801_22535 [bacterium]|nr:hypothetical protein [bacterium]